LVFGWLHWVDPHVQDIASRVALVQGMA
jgi:hypothetical protein